MTAVLLGMAKGRIRSMSPERSVTYVSERTSSTCILHFLELGHVAASGFAKTSCCFAKTGRVRELIAARTPPGILHELRAGMLFHIPPGPPGHDSWVVGDAPYVSLHFLAPITAQTVAVRGE